MDATPSTARHETSPKVPSMSNPVLSAVVDPRSPAAAMRQTIVAARCRPTECRTEWPVREQTNRTPICSGVCWATGPEQNAILFGAAVTFSRGNIEAGAMHVLGPIDGHDSLWSAQHFKGGKAG